MRKAYNTRHHLTPKCRARGQRKQVLDPHAILMLARDKHDMWHRLFKNNTLEEIIVILQRVLKIKRKKYGTKPL